MWIWRNIQVIPNPKWTWVAQVAPEMFLQSWNQDYCYVWCWIEAYSHRKALQYVPEYYKIDIFRRSKQCNIGGTTTIAKRNGRKPEILSENYENLLNYVWIHNKEPLYVIAAQYWSSDRQKLSARTIRRNLYANKIKSYVSAAKLYRSAEHIVARLDWGVIRQQWTTTQWDSVALTDESSLNFRPPKNHLFVWRKVEMRYEITNVVPNFNEVMHRCVSGECFPAMDAVLLFAFPEPWISSGTLKFSSNT